MCKTKPHKGIICDEAIAKIGSEKEKADLLKFYKANLAFWCQGKNGTCGYVMLKDKACNHMKCPKCEEHSCHGCGQLWDTNKNGNDNYWSSDPKSKWYSVHY